MEERTRKIIRHKIATGRIVRRIAPIPYPRKESHEEVRSI